MEPIVALAEAGLGTRPQNAQRSMPRSWSWQSRISAEQPHRFGWNRDLSLAAWHLADKIISHVRCVTDYIPDEEFFSSW